MELVEFLQARAADEEAADRAVFLADCPPEHLEWAAARYERLMATAALRYTVAVKQLGWAIADALGWQSRMRARAAAHADHPDYRQDWKP